MSESYRCDSRGVVIALVLSLAGMSWDAIHCLADEAFTPPSEDERKAVAALSEKGATLIIDGRYQVFRVSIATSSQITDDDLRHLGAFKNLKGLQLSGSKLTDAAIEHLKPLKKLEFLTLATSGITAKATDELKQALPECRISGFSTGFRGGNGGFAGATTAPDSRTSTRGNAGDRGERAPATFPRSLSSELRSPAVEQDLKLTPEQKQEITKLNSRDYIDTQINSLLTADQRARVQQIRLQQEGPTAFQRADLANELKLTEDQRATIRRVLEERAESIRKLFEQSRDPSSGRTADLTTYMEGTRRITSEANAKILAALTDEQRQAWNAKIGPLLPVVETRPETRTSGTIPPPGTTEERARSAFSQLDSDKDGKLTAEEWGRSRNVRSAFDRAKIAIEFPASLETFVKQYLQAYSPRSTGNQ